jgi:3-carboxy-cis,cis-muconate cycloisomerase
VDEVRVAANLAAAEGLLSEQRAMAELTGRAALPDYTGAADRLVDSALGRARRFIKDAP